MSPQKRQCSPLTWLSGSAAWFGYEPRGVQHNIVAQLFIRRIGSQHILQVEDVRCDLSAAAGRGGEQKLRSARYRKLREAIERTSMNSGGSRSLQRVVLFSQRRYSLCVISMSLEEVDLNHHAFNTTSRSPGKR